ncbi:hypothetical protein H0H92_013867 [Tricholoma furcatifolium]|nr:hypothetical protein H0H92_013867 [Tricholoma furcatifolium]
MGDIMDHDELDIISSISTSYFYASTPVSTTDGGSISSTGLRRSQRARSSLKTSISAPITRKRSLSLSKKENLSKAHVVKRQKMDDRKAQTGVVNKQRDSRDEARKKWLYCHKNVVQPMLPPNSTFFEHLETELERTHKDSISFKPLHSLDMQPKLIKGGQMKDYQVRGGHKLTMWASNLTSARRAFIFGDDVQKCFVFLGSGMRPFFCLFALSLTLSRHRQEAARWLPSMRVLRFHGPHNERDRLKHMMRGGRNFDIMITTYETYVAEDQWFKSSRWMYCVLDEGHKIKNSDTLLANKVQGLGSLYKLLLTGTPVQNNLGELWGLLHWLLPTVFTQATQSIFNESFDMQKGTYMLPFLNAARELVSTIMLRRTKANVVGNDVPPREELTVFIPLTESQRFWTYRLLTKLPAQDLKKIFAESNDPLAKTEVKDQEAVMVKSEVDSQDRDVLSNVENQAENNKTEGTNKFKQMMNLLMQLRQVCDHPYLLPNAEPEPHDIAEHIVTNSSKLIAIDKLLANILPKGERVLIFSILWSYAPYPLLVLMDLHPGRDDRWISNCSNKKYLAGGLGINLTKATNVIMCDSDWNPQNDLQAIARAHRIGQTKTVKVYRLICQGSVEDQMLDRIRRKLFLSLKIMASDNPTSSENTSLGYGELINILRRGSSALAHSDGGMNLARFLEANVEDILQHSRSLENRRDAKIKGDMEKQEESTNEQLLLDAEEEERRLLSGVAQVQSRLFEGKLVQRYQNNAQIAEEWQSLGKRARGDRTVNVNGMVFMASPIKETIVQPSPKPVKKTRKKFESEEWCIHCRDGGELIAFCEDCLPPGDLDAIGDTLPELYVTVIN